MLFVCVLKIKYYFRATNIQFYCLFGASGNHVNVILHSILTGSKHCWSIIGFSRCILVFDLFFIFSFSSVNNDT